MSKLSFLCLFSFSLLLLTACRQEAPRPWIPVLEQTGFSYLDDTVAEVRSGVDQASGHLRSGESDQARHELDKAHHALLKLEKYFLPMTKVRQLVYDADRLYYLGRKAEVLIILGQSREFLMEMGKAGGKSVEGVVNEVIVMIEDLERTIDMDPKLVSEKMRLLGEKVNLMVLKGDLVLAGAQFSSEK